MNKKSKSHCKTKFIGTVTIAALIILTALFLVPISTVHVGECGGAKTTRLSLVKGDLTKLEEAKNEANKLRANKAEALRKKPGLAMGCTAGPIYKLYLI